MPVAQVHRSDIAVCGRRDVSLPRSNQRRRQKDEETRLTWTSRTKSCAAAAVYQELFTQFARQSCPNGAQQAPCAPCSLLPAETFCPHGLQTDQNRSGR